MSIKSRARNPNQPTPVSGRPRRFGELSTTAPVNLTELQDNMHKANLTAGSGELCGAFGSPTKQASKHHVRRGARAGYAAVNRVRRLNPITSLAKATVIGTVKAGDKIYAVLDNGMRMHPSKVPARCYPDGLIPR